MRVVSYSRVSTTEQGQSGLGLEAQRQTIANTAQARGWEIVAELADTSSGKTLQRRPSLAEALRMVDSGEADALVAAKLDRISRSLLDFAGLVERARRHGWALVALDSPADMSTPQGELVAGVFASFVSSSAASSGSAPARPLR
ncbi:MAG: recombinase family protein [Thermoleophilia bacterium]